METQQNVVKSESKFNIGFFFLSLGMLVSLVVSVVSFLNLVFESLNKKFPDVLNASYQYGYYSYGYEGMRSALATLIIFFPVFVLITYFWNKFDNSSLGSRDLQVKKWLIFLILFLCSAVVVGDLIALVRYFISGEITFRFILKVLAVLITAKIVGIYYILTLQTYKYHNFKKGLVLGGLGTALVIGAIVWSFVVMGSPAKQRSLRLDERRVNDLQSIQYNVINFWQQKEKLPKDLAELRNPLTGVYIPTPPEVEKGEVYEYIVKDVNSLTFELCATFDLPMPKGWQEYTGGEVWPMPMYNKEIASYPYPIGGANESWDHEVGRTCFERTIDPDIYPPFPKN